MMSPKEESMVEEQQQQQQQGQPVPSCSSLSPHQRQQQIQEEKISSSTSTSSELPPNFSLLAPIHVPVTITSAEIFDLCRLKWFRANLGE